MSDFYFEPGTLINLNIFNRSFTEDGYSTICMLPNEQERGYVYESIDLYSYPSSSDFKGKNTLVKHGDTATILKKIGRPLKINKSKNWGVYDIYEIMLSGSEIRHVFRYNIKIIKKPE